jgi:hypothetical protein
MNIIYNSTARLCAELDGVVVHVEKRDRSAEARVPGTGGPRSGAVVGHLIDGHWAVEPSSEGVRSLINTAMAAA